MYLRGWANHSYFLDGCVLGESDVIVDLDDFAIFEVLVVFYVMAKFVGADIGVERLGLVNSSEGELVFADENLHSRYVLLLSEDDFGRYFSVHPKQLYCTL